MKPLLGSDKERRLGAKPQAEKNTKPKFWQGCARGWGVGEGRSPALAFEPKKVKGATCN